MNTEPLEQKQSIKARYATFLQISSTQVCSTALNNKNGIKMKGFTSMKNLKKVGLSCLEKVKRSVHRSVTYIRFLPKA